MSISRIKVRLGGKRKTFPPFPSLLFHYISFPPPLTHIRRSILCIWTVLLQPKTTTKEPLAEEWSGRKDVQEIIVQLIA